MQQFAQVEAQEQVADSQAEVLVRGADGHVPNVEGWPMAQAELNLPEPDRTSHLGAQGILQLGSVAVEVEAGDEPGQQGAGDQQQADDGEEYGMATHPGRPFAVSPG